MASVVRFLQLDAILQRGVERRRGARSEVKYGDELKWLSTSTNNTTKRERGNHEILCPPFHIFLFGDNGRRMLQRHRLTFIKRTRFPGRRLNSVIGLSLSDRTILFLVILLDKTVSIE